MPAIKTTFHDELNVYLIAAPIICDSKIRSFLNLKLILLRYS